MKRILHLKSSLLGSSSYSIQLGNEVVSEIITKYPGSKVEELDLVQTEMPHLTPQVLQTFFIPAEQLTEEHKELISLSNQLTEQLLNSDIIVIGAPLINFTIHSSLKAWIDYITRAGITFGYVSDGRPVGKVVDKKVYIAMSSGGVYSEGPGKENDFVTTYLKAFLGFLGMTDITVVRAEGLKIPDLKDFAMEKAINSIEID